MTSAPLAMYCALWSQRERTDALYSVASGFNLLTQDAILSLLPHRSSGSSKERDEFTPGTSAWHFNYHNIIPLTHPAECIILPVYKGNNSLLWLKQRDTHVSKSGPQSWTWEMSLLPYIIWFHGLYSYIILCTLAMGLRKPKLKP